MKKLFLTAAMSFSVLAFAQIDLSSTRFGVTAGGNYSRVRNAHNPSGPLYTFQAGAMALIPVGNSDQFYLQPEVLYYGAGESGKDKTAKGKSGYDAVYANNYISVPVFFKGYFSEAESEFFGMAGPRINFLLSQNVKNVPVGKEFYNPDVNNPAHPEVNGKANSFNLGIGLAVGYSYKRQVELALGYDIGLSNTYPNLVESWTGDASASKKKSEQVVSVKLAYIFD